MKITFVFSLLLVVAGNNVFAQIIPAIVSMFDAKSAINAKTQLIKSQDFNDQINHAYERSINQTQLKAVAAKLEVEEEGEALANEGIFSAELEKMNEKINLLTKQLEKGTIVANAVQAMSFVEGTVTGSMKLAQVYRLQGMIVDILNRTRDSTTNSVYPTNSTISSGYPFIPNTQSNNTIFTSTYSGNVYTAREQADIIGQLDVLSELLKWQMFDVANVITQTVTFTASSAARYDLICDVYKNIYNIYVNARKFRADINQTLYFRKLQASSQLFGQNTYLVF